MGQVSLREITADTVIDIVRLRVAPEQEKFVADNAVSFAQALFAPEAWYRAIYEDDTPVGFVMLSDDSLLPEPPEQPEISVWRFMVDARYQRRGIGEEAMRQVIEHARAKGLFSVLTLSYVPEPGSAETFYLRAGFRHTGRMDEDEVVLELPLLTEEA